jgi:hypothetical protein
MNTINFVRAKFSAIELLEAITAAQHVEKPLTRQIRIEEAETHLQDLARELGFRVEPVAAPFLEAAE